MSGPRSIEAATVRELNAEASLYEAQVKSELRRERANDARTLLFNSDVDENTVEMALETLHDWELEGDDPITIVLNSPGGEVFSGLLLFDTLRASDSNIITVTRGLAASMGSILAQAGDVRLVSKHSWYMVHEPSSIAWGKMGDIKREAKMLERLHEQLCDILAERSSLSRADIKRRSQDKDWWLSAEEALEVGFFDGYDE